MKIEERLNSMFPDSLDEGRTVQLSVVNPTMVDSHINKRVIKYFGITDNYYSAMYILPDGQFLDGSGALQGSSNGGRNYDHRVVTGYVKKQYKSPSQKMWYFMYRSGCVRCHFSDNNAYFESVNIPNRRQIESMLSSNAYEVTLEIRNKQLESIASQTFTEPSRSDIELFLYEVLHSGELYESSTPSYSEEGVDSELEEDDVNLAGRLTMLGLLM